jgi:hypothetical protein
MEPGHFGDGEAGLRKHLLAHAAGDARTALESGLRFASYDYDWAINDAR